MPERIQLRRTKGWRKPDGAVVVARPSKWGNPFPVKGDWIMWTAVALGHKADAAGRRAASVALHRAWLTGDPVQPGPMVGSSPGAIGFSDGTVRTVDSHIRGIAAGAAALIGAPPVLPPSPLDHISELAGRDLACWCPLAQPCHADVLLALANPAPDPESEAPDA